jgi:hypothetical protein
VIFQEEPAAWVAHGLELDLVSEARSIGDVVRSVLRALEAHSASDAGDGPASFATVRPAPQTYWNAYNTGTPITLGQLGVTAPAEWQISLALARRRSTVPSRARSTA